MRFRPSSFLRGVLLLALVPVASATTWYVNGVSGSDSHNCLSPSTACKTIGHAISLASSGDTILVAAATYKENLAISKSLNLLGSGATTIIIQGGEVKRLVTIPNASTHVTLSAMTIHGSHFFGGIYNSGTLTVISSAIRGNGAFEGGGIFNAGTVTIINSTVSGNFAASLGGGIGGTATLQNSIVANNTSPNCYGTMTSNGHNLSSDDSCNFNHAGDLKNTNPQLGPLQNNGGPTQTMALHSGSPAIDPEIPPAAPTAWVIC